MKKWNSLSFFTGAGGLDLGFEKAGLHINLCIEKENLFCDTLKKNHPSWNVIQHDIMDVTIEKLLSWIGSTEIDVMFGGSPCQSFSNAGKKTGFLDERGQAMLQFATLIEGIQPKMFVIENVKGFYSSTVEYSLFLAALIDQNEDAFPMTSFEYLSYFLPSYQFVKPQLLNSADFGVPQKRERVFLVGIRNDLPLTYEYPLPTHTSDTWKTFRDVMIEVEGLVPHYVPLPKRIETYLKHVPAGGGYWRDLPESMQQEALGKAYFSSGGRTGFFRRIYADRPSPTLVTSPIQKSTLLAHPFEVRPLSIEEYTAIQTFPKNYYIEGSIQKQYTQIGNAVPVLLAEHVGKQIVSYLNTLSK